MGLDSRGLRSVPHPAAAASTASTSLRGHPQRLSGLELWPRLGLVAILMLAAGLLLWELPDNGWANAYYSTAVRAATHSWGAFLTASLDSSGTISVDKTPLSIWMMALSARAFGFTPAALLVPNALCALGSVTLLHAIVRRALGVRVALLAALFLAITPALVAVGRFNNPDALLVLLLLASTYSATRALETGRSRHGLACGALLGLAFNTKMLQAYLVLPALAAGLLVGGGTDARTRLRLAAFAAGALIVVSLAWIVPVSLLPASTRPWVGDTTSNSWWQLVVGANGVGRIAGYAPASAGSAGVRALRLLSLPTAGQIAWLLPLALAGAGLAVRCISRRREPTAARANLALWVLWAVVHIVAFSLLGLFHPYYTSALAPAVAALAAYGAHELWRSRACSGWWVLLAGSALALSTLLAMALLAGHPAFLPWLPAVLAVLAAGGVGLAVAARLRRAPTLVAATAGSVLLLSLALGPLSYSWAATQRQIGGIDPLAAPGPREEPGWVSDDDPARDRLIHWLIAHQGRAHYLTAVSGSLAGAPLGLLSGRPVLIMGGFAGSDPAPSAGRLADLVRRGQVDTVVLSATPTTADGGTAPGLGGARARSDWVVAHCRRAALSARLPSPSGRLTVRVYRCA